MTAMRIMVSAGSFQPGDKITVAADWFSNRESVEARAVPAPEPGKTANIYFEREVVSLGKVWTERPSFVDPDLAGQTDWGDGRVVKLSDGGRVQYAYLTGPEIKYGQVIGRNGVAVVPLHPTVAQAARLMVTV